MTFRPKAVNRLRQQVEEQLVEGIVSGELAVGERLPPESELARMFSVSRSTVREALRSLTGVGLIETIPGASGGSFIRELHFQRLGDHVGELIDLVVRLGNAQRSDVATVRRIFEVPSCRLAAIHRTSDDLDVLRQVVDRQKVVSIDSPEVPSLDVEFHGAIASASGNPVLAALVHGLHSVAQPVQHLALTADVGRQTVIHHVAIVQAIAEQNPDVAEEAIRAHLAYLDAVGGFVAEDEYHLLMTPGATPRTI
ncbi:MAG TPA: FadR/GntR family transcriptional regulator [Acidimicrobiales bacterium]|jgi:GntR family transcriptional repressor for pyruvate dehydrogenase complex|nr:FadR/GntR family transcriptional regulator [Acidimicrobiales bacterium]